MSLVIGMQLDDLRRQHTKKIRKFTYDQTQVRCNPSSESQVSNYENRRYEAEQHRDEKLNMQ